MSTDLAARLGAETLPQVECVFLTQAAAGRATDEPFPVFVALENHNTNMANKSVLFYAGESWSWSWSWSCASHTEDGPCAFKLPK